MATITTTYSPDLEDRTAAVLNETLEPGLKVYREGPFVRVRKSALAGARVKFQHDAAKGISRVTVQGDVPSRVLSAASLFSVVMVPVLLVVVLPLLYFTSRSTVQAVTKGLAGLCPAPART